MRLTNRYNYPEAFCLMAQNHMYELRAERIGVTQLIKSPQIRRLVLKHWADLVIDVDDMFAAIVGTCFHKGLEKNVPPGKKAEQKWENNIDGFVLVGKADLSNGGIEDYKLTSAWSWVFGDESDWAEQLNVLNWLRVKHGDKPAEYLRIHCFFRDWSAYKAMDKDYPQARYIGQDLPVWPLEKTEAFIHQRMALHNNPSYACTDEDKWIKLEKWAVKHKGKEKADRLLDTAAEASEYIMMRKWEQDYAKGNVYIEQRKTEPKNCTSYCSARSVCAYARSL
jgi:hypothetical protein